MLAVNWREGVSSFLAAHQYIMGYSLPWKGG